MTIRVAVLSDIHAFNSSTREDPRDKPSLVDVAKPGAAASDNPFVALKELIEQDNLNADILVCGGDLGDAAEPEATRYAWRHVQQLGGQLKVSLVLPATGNHDMDSRHKYNDFDAQATLHNLENYPFASAPDNNEYWARNVVVRKNDEYRYALLNSSAFHGEHDQWKHGRVAKRTRDYLEQQIKNTGESSINILVTHHHVYKLGSLDLEDYSEMRDGSALVELLSETSLGSWIVIHGHQHWPKISYANGSRSAPVVFSAGSFSAVIWPELGTQVRNQFYILELEAEGVGHPIQGTFQAWDYIYGKGFRQAQPGSGLPAFGGFGGGQNGAQLATAISALFTELDNPPYITYAEILDRIPDVQFAMPGDRDQCLVELATRHDIEVLLSSSGRWSQLTRKGSK